MAIIYFDLAPYNAPSNGTNAATAIQSALNAAKAGDVVTSSVAGRNRVYSLSGYLTIWEGDVGNPIILDLNGTTFKGMAGSANQAGWLRSAGDSSGEKVTSAVLNQGATSFVDSANAGLCQLNDIINIRGPYITGTYQYGLLSRVTGVSGNTVSFAHPVVLSFTGTSFYRYRNNSKNKPRGNFVIRNGYLDFRNQTGGKAIQLSMVMNVLIENIEIEGTPSHATTLSSLQQGIGMDRCVGITVRKCKIHGGQTNNNGSQISGCYAIAPDGQDILVEDCELYDWSSLLAGGFRVFNSVTLTAQYNTLTRGNGTGQCLNFHGVGGGLMKGNIIRAGLGERCLVGVRFGWTTVEDNEIIVDGSLTPGTSRECWAIECYEQAFYGNINIKNNKFTLLNPSNASIRAISVAQSNMEGQFKDLSLTPAISNLVIEGNQGHGSYILGHSQASNADNGRIGTGIRICNNEIQPAPAGESANYEIDFRNTNSGTGFEICSNIIQTNNTASGNRLIQTPSGTPASGSKVINNSLYEAVSAQNPLNIRNQTNVQQSNNPITTGGSPSWTPGVPLDYVLPTVPDNTILTSAVTTTTITLSWTKAFDRMTLLTALQYKVYRSLLNNISTIADCEANGTLMTTLTDASTYQATGLPIGTPIFFNIIVVDRGGNKAIYAAKQQATSGSPVDAQPPTISNGTITASAIAATTATLSWQKATDDVTSQNQLLYTVYRSLADNISTIANAKANGTVVHSGNDLSSLNLSGLPQYTNLFFNIIVRDMALKESIYNRVTFRTLDATAPTAPNTTITPSNITTSSTTLAWARASDNATPQATLVYRLYFSLSDNISTVADMLTNGTLIMTQADTVSINLSELPAGQKRYYNLFVEDEAQNRLAYTRVEVTTAALPTQDTTPPVPGGSGLVTASNITANSCTISWARATDNVTPQNQLKYTCAKSLSANLTNVTNFIDAGIQIGNGVDIITINAVDLASDTDHWFNIMVEDAATPSNKALYSQLYVRTGAVTETGFRFVGRKKAKL